MARIPTATRESVPENQRDAYDQVIGERGGSHPAGGPIAIMINVPEITKRGEHLRAYLRGEDSSLPTKVRELAMLVTAREQDSRTSGTPMPLRDGGPVSATPWWMACGIKRS